MNEELMIKLFDLSQYRNEYLEFCRTNSPSVSVAFDYAEANNLSKEDFLSVAVCLLENELSKLNTELWQIKTSASSDH